MTNTRKGSRWEIFDPRDGEPITTTRFRWLARLLTRGNGLDFALEGDGWARS